MPSGPRPCCAPRCPSIILGRFLCSQGAWWRAVPAQMAVPRPLAGSVLGTRGSFPVPESPPWGAAGRGRHGSSPCLIADIREPAAPTALPSCLGAAAAPGWEVGCVSRHSPAPQKHPHPIKMGVCWGEGWDNAPAAREVSGGDVLGPILHGVWGCFWIAGSIFGHHGAPGVSAGGWFGLGSASREDGTPCTCPNTPFGATPPHGWSLCHFLPLLCEICFLRASRGGAGSTIPHTPTPLQWDTRPDVPVTPDPAVFLPCLPCPGQAAVPEAGHGAPMGFPWGPSPFSQRERGN